VKAAVRDATAAQAAGTGAVGPGLVWAADLGDVRRGRSYDEATARRHHQLAQVDAAEVSAFPGPRTGADPYTGPNARHTRRNFGRPVQAEADESPDGADEA
jgi:hypothetical protein